MIERAGFPPGVPCWVDTTQPDPEAALDFYGGVFGWVFEDRMPPEAPGRYFVARLGGRDVAAISSQPEGGSPAPVWNTYIWVDDTDATVALVRDAGGRVITEPFDVLDAGRMAACTDASGAVFHLWQAGTHRGAQAVNEPGSWNWSDLNTRDIEGAKAFYGSVFGWQADTLDLGFGESTMVRLPGYAEFLERFDPQLRQRHAEQGGPPGFSDCIAWMQPMSSDRFAADVPPHWSVTFAVADTDAVAATAAELGGRVVTPPFDAGPVRIAVLSDPQGAAFSVNTYQPGEPASGAG
ncbi:MAG TPA: VOC family protein [Jiangellaceae bacterium]|nr:VOC family protein [Jiangellaceae bacterium]